MGGEAALQRAAEVGISERLQRLADLDRRAPGLDHRIDMAGEAENIGVHRVAERAARPGGRRLAQRAARAPACMLTAMSEEDPQGQPPSAVNLRAGLALS